MLPPAKYDRNRRFGYGRTPVSRELSTREKEVLIHVVSGRTAKQIGFILNISVKTVQAHKFNLKLKLQLNGTADLVKYAISSGLIASPLPSANDAGWPQSTPEAKQ